MSDVHKHDERGMEKQSPGEIKSREVVLGYRERELDICFSCFPSAELRILSL